MPNVAARSACFAVSLYRYDQGKGARLTVPGIIDLSDLVADSSGVSRILLEAVQEMLLRVALQTARDDYETRRERQREGLEIPRREEL